MTTLLGKAKEVAGPGTSEPFHDPGEETDGATKGEPKILEEKEEKETRNRKGKTATLTLYPYPTKIGTQKFTIRSNYTNLGIFIETWQQCFNQILAQFSLRKGL